MTAALGAARQLCTALLGFRFFVGLRAFHGTYGTNATNGDIELPETHSSDESYFVPSFSQCGPTDCQIFRRTVRGSMCYVVFANGY